MNTQIVWCSLFYTCRSF